MSTLAFGGTHTIAAPAETPRYRRELFVHLLLGGWFGGILSTLLSLYWSGMEQGMPERQTLPAWMGSLIAAAFVAGWALGGILWGRLADRYGRRPVWIASLLVAGLGALATAAAGHTWLLLLFCRLVTGFGVGGVLVLSFTYIAEVWPSPQRAVAAGLLAIAFPAGIFSAGLLRLAAANWQQAFLVGLLPLLLSAWGYARVQEPARWRQSKQPDSRATSSLVRNDGLAWRRWYGAGLFGSMLIGLWAIFLWLPAWAASLQPAAGAGNPEGLSMILMGGCAIAGSACSGLLVDRFGYRRSLLGIFSLIIVVTATLFGGAERFGYPVAAAIGLMGLVFGASQGILSALIPQLFPVAQRAAATGFAFNAARFLTAAAVLLVGLANSEPGHYGATLLACSLVFVPGLLLVWRLPALATDEAAT